MVKEAKKSNKIYKLQNSKLNWVGVGKKWTKKRVSEEVAPAMNIYTASVSFWTKWNLRVFFAKVPSFLNFKHYLKKDAMIWW